MSTESGLLDELIEALRCLPGVGAKSAQRMALHLLQRDRNGGRFLGQRLIEAMDRVQHCRLCRNFTENALCRYCADEARDTSELCVVESPADLLAVERAARYRGRYFLLLGTLSPLDGVGPAALGLDLLDERLAGGEVTSLTLALNSTVEGQATARYIAELAAKHDVTVYQIARGLPMGGELEFADSGTLSVAFAQRTPLAEG
ncbi:MAG: recombination protein RecR [Gammaproteobacteria bacterium]|nr:MAG: recombination protein RecR [Gammaproteobacteria bacterium]